VNDHQIARAIESRDDHLWESQEAYKDARDAWIEARAYEIVGEWIAEDSALAEETPVASMYIEAAMDRAKREFTPAKLIKDNEP
jgi:hypothetical protein